MVWGYAKENGPHTWVNQFPIAGGPKQSPIDIECKNCKSDGALSSVDAKYNDIKVSELSNSGHSWKAQIVGGVSSLTKGPLSDEFVLEQFHCHWGKSDATGSEHTINGTSYAAELHLVHWNKTKFKSFGEAASADGGLAVLGIFLKSGSEHKELLKITKLLPFIQYKGQAISITESIDPALFLPNNRTYFSYGGSLTTPPCYESVNWIVFEQPVEVSEKQLQSFRNMKSFHPCEKCPQDELGGCLFENYRPPCPLNNRVVKVYKSSPKEE